MSKDIWKVVVDKKPTYSTSKNEFNSVKLKVPLAVITYILLLIVSKTLSLQFTLSNIIAVFMSVLATTEILFFIFRYYLKNYFNNNVVNMIFSLIYVFCSIILGISLLYYLITFFLNIYIKEIILLPRFIYFTWLLSTITSGCISSYYGKRDNFLSKTQNFANEAISELSKTDFPDFRSTISMTALVIITLSLWCVVSRIINSMLISPFLFFIGVR